MNKYAWLCAVLLAGVLPLQAQIQRPRDIVPTENVTSLEFSPSLDVMDNSGSVSRSALTFKGGYAVDKYLNFALELPLARYEAPDKSKNGLGDATLSATVTSNYQETWSFGATADVVVPTATGKELGSGKVQVNPALFAVYMPHPSWFISLGYRQYWSVAGDGGRENTNQGRLRAVLAYLSDSKWWILADPRYIIDYENPGQARFSPEAEIGTMVNAGTSVYLRAGGKAGGNMPGPDWTVTMGFRVLYL